ncbi:MAG: methylenetetrahydrofolate reductase C-terminal domain-containing protein [Deltaproteobacteria bacterium]|nr:methylenetetrahydrofolate reductase C-terminal domain-containing protein [Deltaproteobacteria bacterium]
MIKAEQKPVDEILGFLDAYKRILLVGCNGCAAVCHAGGEREVAILAATLRMARKKLGQKLEILEETSPRQCEPEFVDALAGKTEDVEAILSIACGVGVQALAERFSEIPVYPGVNTMFMGKTVEPGVWVERCQACGNCVLHLTGGICPVTRCAKQLLNGPCGGSRDGVCEIDGETPCAWQAIYDRLKATGQLDRLELFVPAKRWGRESRDRGPRTIVRGDLKQ